MSSACEQDRGAGDDQCGRCAHAGPFAAKVLLEFRLAAARRFVPVPPFTVPGDRDQVLSSLVASRFSRPVFIFGTKVCIPEGIVLLMFEAGVFALSTPPNDMLTTMCCRLLDCTSPDASARSSWR